MPDFLQNINKSYQKLTTKVPTYDRPFIRPSHDWMVILITAQTIIIIMAGVATFFYLKVDRGELFKVLKDESTNEVKINSTLLSKTVKDINEREENLTRINQGSISPPDPSL